jgi:hypothetical protein
MVFLVFLVFGFLVLLVVFAAVVRVVFLGFFGLLLLFFAAEFFCLVGAGGFSGFLFELWLAGGFSDAAAEFAEAGFGNRAALLQGAAAGLHGFPEGVAAGVEERGLRAGG